MSDYEIADGFTESFSTTKIRNAFIRKVYLILTCLLVYTSGVISLFCFEPHCRAFVHKYYIIGLVCLIISLVFYFVLVCVKNARRKIPLNYILLGLYTFFTAFGFATIAAQYAPELVLYSFIITAGICGIITLVACQPCIDITGCGAFLCIIGIGAMVFGMVVMILSLTTGIGKILFIIYSAVIGLVICLYFMYITQLILGGKRFELSPEEYIYGAVLLYTEVMQIFLLVLRIGGLLR